jgi:RNA polymerase sigma-70 factor (ECF subfamily)
MNLLLNLSDNELVSLCQKNHSQAFETLVHRHKDRVYSSIFFLVKEQSLAEDIFQDTFLKALQRIREKRYNEEGKFLQWILRIAHNLCVDHFRFIKRRPAVVLQDGRDVFEVFQFSTTDNAEEKIIRSQTHHRLHLYIAKLPPEQREILVLRHFADMSFKDIAAMTNCSINTALGRMRYALLNLRKMMKEKQLA